MLFVAIPALVMSAYAVSKITPSPLPSPPPSPPPSPLPSPPLRDPTSPNCTQTNSSAPTYESGMNSIFPSAQNPMPANSNCSYGNAYMIACSNHLNQSTGLYECWSERPDRLTGQVGISGYWISLDLAAEYDDIWPVVDEDHPVGCSKYLVPPT